MSRSSWPLFFAGFCIFAYTLSVVYVFTGLSGLHNLGEEKVENKSGEEVDPDTKNETDDLIEFSRVTVAAYTYTFVVELGMLICSVLLYIGVKKQNYKFIAPWLWMFLFAVIDFFVSSFLEENNEVESYYEMSTMICIAAFWYPIYKHYKQLRYPKTTEHKCCCTEIAHTYNHVAAHPHAMEFVHSAPTHCTATAPTHVC